MQRLTGAEIIAHLLERQGIRTVAGIPGGANLPLYDALSQSGAIRHVLARHEQGAGFIAQGMARVSGVPAVCLATSGPGATNVLTAVADARLDSVPLVCITGQVPGALIGTDAFQEVDTYGMSIPITKHNYLVRSAGDLLRVVPEAFRIAASGRPGPVLIDVPKDVQLQAVEVPDWPAPGRADPLPEVDPIRLAGAAEMINRARRPILWVGGGVIQSGASEPARQLAEKAALPVASTLMGLGVLPAGHPLLLGMLGMHGSRSTNLSLQRCDLLVAVGVRFDDRATGDVPRFCPDARIIHVDIDASELGKIKPAHQEIVGDAGLVLEALLPLVERADRSAWLASVAALRQGDPAGFADPGTPCGLIRRVGSLLDEDAIVVTDVGQHQMWTAQAYPFRGPRRWLTSGGLGTMGFGLPAAIGASLACPGQTVVCVSGDGSLLMNVQELATAAEEGANVKILLMDNRSLGLVRQQQDLFYGRRTFASVFRSPVDFVRIAEGFGVEAYDLCGDPTPEATLSRALRRNGPCLIRAPIDGAEMVYPMVPPGASNTDMIGGDTDADARH